MLCHPRFVYRRLYPAPRAQEKSCAAALHDTGARRRRVDQAMDSLVLLFFKALLISPIDQSE